MRPSALHLSVILFVAGIALSQQAWAFPTEAEIKTATDVVGDLVADDVRAANAGKVKREDVAGKIYGYMDQAETDAAKWVLLKHAFIQYAKAYNFEKAGEIMSEALEAFPDAPPQTIIALIEKNCPKASAKNAPVLAKIRKVMYMRQKCSGVVANPKASKKEKAEAYCLLGNWKKGLALLKSADGKTAEVVAGELNGKMPKQEIANFWWDYKSELDTCDQFKAHAVEVYKAGLADGSIGGLYKTVAEKRIAEIEAAPTMAAPESKTPGESELAKLKKVCNTTGLVHCWRFNGNLKDCVGKNEAKCCGNAKVDKKQASVFGSEGGEKNNCIDLGPGIIPNDGSPVTIELWATQNKIADWARVFSFGRFDGPNIWMTWTQGSDIYRCEFCVWEGHAVGHVLSATGHGFGPYEIGVEYHVALVFDCNSKQGWTMNVYKQDAKTGSTIAKKECFCSKKDWTLKGYATPSCVLGKSCNSINGANIANASYNEVRIWKRALSEQELTQNAIKFHKAGETAK